jgi:hypothetical protein
VDEESFPRAFERARRALLRHDDTWGLCSTRIRVARRRIVVARRSSCRHARDVAPPRCAPHEAKVPAIALGKSAWRVIQCPATVSKSKSGPGIGHQIAALCKRWKEPIWNAKWTRRCVRRFGAGHTHWSTLLHAAIYAPGATLIDRIVSGKTYRYYADDKDRQRL